MNMLEIGEIYLEAILLLSKEKDGVHAIDVCEKLNITKPSVSVMLKKLREDKYITIDSENHLHLTETGLEIANKIYERHEILTDILIHLGRLKNKKRVVLDESWNKIKEYYQNNIKK